MKKFVGILCTAALTLSLVACGSGGGEQQSSSSEGQSAEGGSGQVYKFRMGNVAPDSQSSSIAARDFIKKVEERSNGRIQIDFFPNGALFPSDREGIEALQLGNVEMYISAAAPLASFNPKFMVFDLPFIFKSKEKAYEVLDGEIGQQLFKELESVGIKGLAFIENGYRHMSNNRGPITKPEDLKGLKFRTMESPVHTATFNAFGANASPFAFGELYTALQQNVYDAMESPISLYYTNKFYEVQDYLTLSGHFYAASVFLMNLDTYNSLPEDLRQIIDEEAAAYRDAQRKLATQQDEEWLEELKKNGMQVNELTPEQKDAFIQAAQPVYEEFADQIGRDLIDAVIKANNE
ncbi:DctP family TRAP transporter solute-binding subunit [Brevibacillus marinus]|uniref:TRAP transporter substrate-binding protein n=1 Tax=Brevibacillus marinus TaxID=2496837 RepID=UPI001F49AED7|nr:DctP family TRAP transporter solute-binding subunit [Brevibacillus marinus]